MPATTPSIADNIARLTQAIRQFEQEYAREPYSVQLIAVSKTQPASAIRDAAHTGQRDFAENYLQEGLEKQQALADPSLCWHFIGPIQSNKTRDIASHFDWVHSVDRDRIARRLQDQRPADRPPLNVLLQVNLSGEASKSGVTPEALPALAGVIADCPRLRLRGLMAIPAPEPDFERQRATFRRLADARDALIAAGHDDCRELSMGMSGDFEAAIAEGATLIRIGTGIFGSRPGS